MGLQQDHVQPGPGLQVHRGAGGIAFERLLQLEVLAQGPGGGRGVLPARGDQSCGDLPVHGGAVTDRVDPRVGDAAACPIGEHPPTGQEAGRRGEPVPSADSDAGDQQRGGQLLSQGGSHGAQAAGFGDDCGDVCRRPHLDPGVDQLAAQQHPGIGVHLPTHRHVAAVDQGHRGADLSDGQRGFDAEHASTEHDHRLAATHDLGQAQRITHLAQRQDPLRQSAGSDLRVDGSPASGLHLEAGRQRLRTGGQHQPVVGERAAVLERHLAVLSVDFGGGHRRAHLDAGRTQGLKVGQREVGRPDPAHGDVSDADALIGRVVSAPITVRRSLPAVTSPRSSSMSRAATGPKPSTSRCGILWLMRRPPELWRGGSAPGCS
ncbi:hypothetical protein BG28_00770 [Nesterenkonia sp. AN1]|nr:hypothetical protein [Nesterenkonia sp. AN1]EXF26298.1 hypothetical protein BG28_00770 [Nesterenkonia sp. AN1]